MSYTSPLPSVRHALLFYNKKRTPFAPIPENVIHQFPKKVNALTPPPIMKQADLAESDNKAALVVVTLFQMKFEQGIDIPSSLSNAVRVATKLQMRLHYEKTIARKTDNISLTEIADWAISPKQKERSPLPAFCEFQALANEMLALEQSKELAKLAAKMLKIKEELESPQQIKVSRIKRHALLGAYKFQEPKAIVTMKNAKLEMIAFYQRNSQEAALALTSLGGQSLDQIVILQAMTENALI